MPRRRPHVVASFVVLRAIGSTAGRVTEGSPPQTEAADGGRAGLKRNDIGIDNNYLLRRFFFGARFEAGAEAPAPPPAAFWSALFVARVGAAAMGSSGHGCFGYRPRCSARTEG